ncbi:MAG: hypothetical protein H6606_05220 [Flavobacteriales bacterium]|nr:hypothetical protein [Flavobacteriales bacterium]
MKDHTSTTFNNTRFDRVLEQEVDQLLGKRFGLMYKLKNGSVGSEPFIVQAWKGDFNFDPESKDYDRKCNMELRPKGIIVHYRKQMSTFIWPIPFHQLTIFQSAGIITIYQNTNFLKVKPMYRRKMSSPFIRKVLEAKAGLGG